MKTGILTSEAVWDNSKLIALKIKNDLATFRKLSNL
jgi:hypothetical protein